jgi:hypothetical protein
VWYITLIPGALLGAGLALIIATLLPRQSKLSAVMERMGTTSTIADHSGTDLETRVGSWVHSRLPDLPGFTIPTKDLELVGTPVNNYLYQKARDALLLLIAPPLVGIILNMIGLPFFAGVAALSGIPLAILGWTGADRDLKKKATVARQGSLEASPSTSSSSPPSAGATHPSPEPSRTRQRSETAGCSSASEKSSAGHGSPAHPHGRRSTISLTPPGFPSWPRSHESPDQRTRAGLPYETLRSTGKGMRVKLLNEEQTRANKLSDQFSSFAGFIVAFLAVGIIFTPLLFNLTST